MGIKIEKRTARDQLLKLVGVADSAINWDASFPGEDITEDEKRKAYAEDHDLAKLVFFADDGGEGIEKPTLFVFDHPARVDVSRKIRGLYAKQMSAKDQADLFTEVWDKAFLGTEEGLDGGVMLGAPRRNGRITEDYFQALEDSSGVFQEMALAFVTVAARLQSKDAVGRKK